MMTLQQFEMALWTLKLLDMQELVDAGAIDDRDYETWDTFQADRMRWFLHEPGEGAGRVDGHLAAQAQVAGRERHRP